MKSSKRIATLLLAIIIVLTLTIPAAAEVIDFQRTGSITLHKYAIEEGMNLILNADGTIIDPSTAITDDGTQLRDLHPLKDVSFSVIRVSDSTTDPDNAPALTGADAYSKTLATAEDGTVKFDGLAVGIYLVTEITNQAILEPAAPFLVSIPMTNPAGNGWIYDVHIYPKNKLVGAPEINKYISTIGTLTDGSKLGDEITWFITSQVPENGISDARKYQIHDDLNEFLPLVEGSVKVYLKGNSDNVYLSVGTHYTLTKNDFGFDILLTPDGLAFVDATISATTSSDRLIYVEYKTTLNIPQNKLEESLGKPISGNAYDTYISAAGIPYSGSIDVKPAVHTGGINLLKVDGYDNDILLSGAKFKIFTSEADAKAGVNPVTSPFGTDDWEVTTAADGTAYFYGLAYGANQPAISGVTSYWIVETQAPTSDSGRYNLLRSPVEITINAASHAPENTITIENFKGFVLPVTGGMGSRIFTITGICLILAGGIVLLIVMLNKKNKLRH